MLYVFLVDTGTMMSFDMNLALESVSKLKEAIARLHKIPEEKQVLLISGGDNLDPSARVCSYSAGTDTNPIYLFSKGTIESSNPPSPSIDCSHDTDLRDQVTGSLILPSTYITVVARTQLAHQFYDIAKEETRVCERLVHEQHLQHQGWSAVVANLEEITSTFRAKTNNFEQHFRSYLLNREFYLTLLTSFSDDLKLLERIPLLEALLGPNRKAKEQHQQLERKSAGEPDVLESDPLLGQHMSLLEWISSKDHQSSLELVAQQCNKGLEQFNQDVFEAAMGEIKHIDEFLAMENMKEIKGLEERLFGLEQLMFDAKKIVQNQGEMAQAFSANQARAGNLNDASILPDLCNSHCQQLKLMLKNHQQLRDIHRRCVLAKEELSKNLHHRLRWIMFVERSMCEVDGRLVIYHENLKKLKRHLDIAQQIHNAPRVYLLSIVEVVRRRNFSQIFLKWAKDLSSQAGSVHKKEVSTRKEFTSVAGSHFLYSLFPGLDDCPPPYAVHAPDDFDRQLPDILASDIEWLRSVLPDMAALLTVASADHLDVLSCIVTATATNAATSSEPRPKQSVHQRLIASLPGNGARPPSPLMSASVQDGFVVPLSDRRATNADPSADESEPEDFVSLDGGIVVANAVATTAAVATSTGPTAVDDEETVQNRQRVHELRDTVRLIQTRHGEALSRLRQDVDEARQFVLHYRDNFWQPGGVLADQITDVVKMVEQQVCLEKDKQMEIALAEAHDNHTSITEALSQKFNQEAKQLVEAQNENRACRAELSAKEADMENLKAEMMRRLDTEKSSSEELLNEEVKKMTLEHELELESVKEECRKTVDHNDKQLQRVQEELTTTLSQLEQLRSDYSSLEIALTERSQREKDEFRERLESDFLSREVAAGETARRQAEQEADQRVLEACDELKRATTAAWEERLAQLELEWRQKAEREREQAVQEAREALLREHKHEMEGLRARFRLAFNTSQVMERSPSDSSLEKIERPDSAEPSRTEQQVATLRAELQDRDNCMEEMRRRHQAAAEELRLQCERFREESLRAMRTSLTAEKQVVFNEAINRATAEKERVISELRAELASVRSGHHSLPPSSPSFDDVSGGVASSPSDGFQFISATSPHKGDSNETSALTVSLAANAIAESFSQSVVVQEQSTRDKCEDHGSIEQNFMAMSAPANAVSTSSPEKVSVMTCNVGDLVLFCFNERYDNYLIFSVTTTYYFLHTDCMEALSLIPEHGQTRRPWVLAVVVEKEYCQARRVPNRFRVPLGMRFYRVRAKPWTRDSASSGKSRMSASVRPGRPGQEDTAKFGCESI